MHTIKFLIHDKFFFEFFSKCHFLVLVSDFIPIFLIILFVYCICTNIIYCISCHKLFQLYIGDTSQRLSDSLVGHLCCWKNKVVNKIKVWAILFTTFWLKLQFPVLCSFKNVLIIHDKTQRKIMTLNCVFISIKFAKLVPECIPLDTILLISYSW